ncbi:MAG: phosphatidylserine decarboxylase family protein, partial [Acidobacteriota bacterium]
MISSDFRDKRHHIPIAREGIPYLVAAMFVTLVSAILGCHILAWPLLAATLLMGHFFRDPDRINNAEENDVVTPAEGNVIAVKRVDGNHF